ncbi:HD domain-containing protein [Candidatus Nitrosocosmicus arcticus]|uniref:HD domain-containing protein n=1 Tax=Candidatus Nitrosocosmicus arcticus TaxID=2035267 RepID=UPI00119EE4DC|nr:HD domain-containing protein [Candidatus Nitrosocosmicus arcticus]
MNISKSTKKWTFNSSYYDYASCFFITLSFASMITTGIFAIPLVSDFFSGKELDWNRDWTNLLFTITSALGCIWGLMAHSQFDITTKLIRNTWHLCRKLDPFIGEYDYKTFDPETNQLEDGYAYHSFVDFWDRENDVPHWLDKGKYWKILLELRKINKNVRLEVTKDANPPSKRGKGNVVVILKKFNQADSTGKKNESIDNKNAMFRIIIPQWLVINTEYKRFNIFSQTEINTITNIISDVNKNIPKIIDEIIFKEKPVLKHSGNILTSLSTYLNKSLPIRIVYSKTKEILPGAKKRQIQYTNENLSSVSLDYLIESILLKARTIGINEESLTKLHLLTQYLKKEYDKVGLGEGSSEYHNLHHSLEVAYMSLNMLPKEIHGYTITKRDYEIMLVAALLHDYDPMQGTSHYGLKYSRVPTVANTIAEIKRKRIHDAYFLLNSEELIRFFRKYESPLVDTQEFGTAHPEMLNGKEPKIESKIVEALIWRTDYPFNENAYNNFNQLLKEIDDQDFSVEKINLIAEILSLADLSVTYLSSDPLLAWNRVVKLYEELDFPLVEAVSRTDRFLSLFSEGSLFKDIISRKNFPDVFRQKWDNVYQFFHEGNPSNKINNLILDAKTKYEKINMDVSTSNCDYLINTAPQNKNEYYIGIVKDKEEIINTQAKLSGLQIENLEILPGNPDNILPFIKDKFVDNFIITIFCDNSEKRVNKERILKNLLHSYKSKLSQDGTIQIIVENEQDFRKIMSLIPEHGFKIISTSNKVTLGALNSDKSKHTNHAKNVKIITIQKLQNNNNNIQK